ncbi:MAG: hypothetical protein ACOCQQ_02355 [Candidatus Nanoarchaeia archaeon]
MTQRMFLKLPAAEEKNSVNLKEFFKIYTNKTLKNEIQHNHILQQTQDIIEQLSGDQQADIKQLCKFVKSNTLEEQLVFFKRAELFAKKNAFSNIELWAEGLNAQKEEIPLMNPADYYETYDNMIKKKGKINVLEKYIPTLFEEQNINFATQWLEFSKNLIQYGSLGFCAHNIKIKNNKYAHISISANPMLHADPIYNKAIWRPVGVNEEDNQHNFLVNVFEDYCALAITENKLYATNAELLNTTRQEAQSIWYKKLVKAKKVPTPQPNKEISMKQIQRVKKNNREIEFEENLITGTLIMYITQDKYYIPKR